MKCPHCKKELELPVAVELNAEAYGGGSYHVVARCCGKAVEVRSRRRVVIELIGKGNMDQVECWR